MRERGRMREGYGDERKGRGERNERVMRGRGGG